MRDSVVNAEFYYLGVNHNEFNIIGMSLVKNTHNDSVDTHGFTGTCSSRNQHMGHFCNVCYYHLSGYILSHCKGNIGRKIPKLLALQKISQCHGRIFLIGNLNTNCSFSRNRCFYSNVGRRQIQLDIIRKAHNFGHLYTLLRLQLITGNTGALTNICNCYLDTEGIQSLLETHGRLLQFPCGISG